MKTQCQTIRLVTVLAAILTVSALGSGRALAQNIDTEVSGGAAAGDRVPEGVSASDWSSIRAAYEGPAVMPPLPRAAATRPATPASNGGRASTAAAFSPRQMPAAGRGGWNSSVTAAPAPSRG